MIRIQKFTPSTQPSKSLRFLPQINLRLSTTNSDDLDVELETIPITDHIHWSKKIHHLSTTSDVDAALRLLDNLRLRGYSPTSLNLSSILHSLCSAGRSSEAHQRLLLFLAAANIPDHRTTNILLAILLNARTPSLTLKVFDSFSVAKPDFVPSVVNYNRLISLLGSNLLAEKARDVFEEMKRRGRAPNVVTYTALINGFAKTGDLGSARQVFDEMSRDGVLPNSMTYSVLIKAVLQKRRVEEGRELICEMWRKMEEDGSVGNAAFANLVESLCREGFVNEVFRIAEEMPQGRSVTDDFAYGQMIDSLCRVRRYHGASRIVYMMRKRGLNPSMVSYNCIVHGLSKKRGSMRAYQLFKEGIEFGYVPSESTYKVLVQGLCREMDMQKAKDVLEFMLERDGFDETRIYNIFLSALQEMDNPSEQLNVLVAMLQRQCQPDVVTLNTIIHGFCKIGRVQEAKKIVDDMISGKFCAPDVVTYTTMIKGLMDVGKAEEALTVLHRIMPQCRCAPNIMTYNAVLRGLVKLQKVDEAMEIFNSVMHKNSSFDSTTFVILIGGLFEADNVEGVKRFWDDVIWASKIHNDYVYAAIMKGLCQKGKFEQACDFLYELVDSGISPGTVNYNIIIDYASKIGLRKYAYQIMGEMRKNGLKPDAITWRILDKFHDKERKENLTCNQASESDMLTKEHRTPGEVDHQDLPNMHYVKEDNNHVNEDPFEGIIDHHFSPQLIAENAVKSDCKLSEMICLIADTCNAKPVRPKKKEPLSKITRIAFGLL